MREAKILIIDDVSENIQILAKFLKLEGYQICFALSGKKGLELVDKNHIDLILCDVMMPEMDGFEVCKILKSNKYREQSQKVGTFINFGDAEKKIAIKSDSRSWLSE